MIRLQAYEEEMRRLRAEAEPPVVQVKTIRPVKQSVEMYIESAEIEYMAPEPEYKPPAPVIQMPKPKPIEMPKPKPIKVVKPILKPVESTIEFAPIMPSVPAREPEMIINVNLPEKGTQHIEVFEEDEANNVARDFCIKHKIRDREKQYKLLNLLETRINDHRYPALPAQRPTITKAPVEEPVAAEPEIVKYQRPELDPKVREECYNIFNDVWYDFDEEKGQITKPKFL